MFNHSSTPKPADRTFRHFFPLKGRVHVVEVHRHEGLYTAKAFLGPEFYVKNNSNPKAMRYPVVAVSMGYGFASLHDAFRSLRKDMKLDAWARASQLAKASSVIEESELPRTRQRLSASGPS